MGTAFAGFISDVPLAKVVVTPLGNGDFANGMDDVYVSVTPVPAPSGLGLWRELVWWQFVGDGKALH